MNTFDDFVTLVRDELGLTVTAEDGPRDLDQIPGWDSLHLLWLLTVIEQRTGRSVMLADILEADSLAAVYELVSAP